MPGEGHGHLWCLAGRPHVDLLSVTPHGPEQQPLDHLKQHPGSRRSPGALQLPSPRPRGLAHCSCCVVSHFLPFWDCLLLFLCVNRFMRASLQ